MATESTIVNEEWHRESGHPQLLVSQRLMGLGLAAFRRIGRTPDGGIRRFLWPDAKVNIKHKNQIHGVVLLCRQVVIDESKGVEAILYRPDHHQQGMGTDQGPLPVVFYFHGGGFALVSARTAHYDAFCKAMCAKLSVLVVSVEYRRSPEHKYPTAYEDCIAAVKWLKEQLCFASEMKERDSFLVEVDLSRLFLMGDSAGGNIVHHVAVALAEDRGAGIDVRGSVLLFPFFGGEERTSSELRLNKIFPLLNLEDCDWYWKAYLPVGESRDHPAANVFGPNSPSLEHVPLPRAWSPLLSTTS